jgi:hypothetical protein
MIQITGYLWYKQKHLNASIPLTGINKCVLRQKNVSLKIMLPIIGLHQELTLIIHDCTSSLGLIPSQEKDKDEAR